MIFNKKNGFTFAEVAMLLLLTTLLLMASMPVITKKHLAQERKELHGKWACKLINGNYRQVALPHADQELPPDNSNSWTGGCNFPSLPSTVKVITVTIVGAGAHGTEAVADVTTSYREHHIFPQNDDRNSINPDSFLKEETFTVPATSFYTIRFEGALGEAGELTKQSMEYRKGGIVYDRCIFPPAPANEKVAFIEFDMFLQEGQKLKMETITSGDDRKNRKNDENPYFCNKTDTYKLKVDGIDVVQSYPADIEMKPDKGQNGYTRKFYIDGQEIATIKGSGGGFWHSGSKDNCKTFCPTIDGIRSPYVGDWDRSAWKAERYITINASAKNKIKENFKQGVGDRKGNKISTNLPSITAHAGCGGGAGQVKSFTMQKPDETLLSNFPIKIGSVDGKTPEERQTQFGTMVANGASETFCSQQGFNRYTGSNGATMAKDFGTGGKGGTGYGSRTSLDGVLSTDIFELFAKIDNPNTNVDAEITDRFMNKIRGCIVDSGYYAMTDGNFDVSNSQDRPDYTAGGRTPAPWCGGSARIYGEDGTGMGTGGGGSGVAVATPDEPNAMANYLDPAKPQGLDRLRKLIFKGTPGRGTSGGIIVEW